MRCRPRGGGMIGGTATFRNHSRDSWVVSCQASSRNPAARMRVRSSACGSRKLALSPSAPPQHAVGLTEEARLVLDVHGAVLRPDDVEAAVDERHVQGAAMAEMDQARQIHALAEQRANLDELLRDVENGDLAAQLPGQRPG